MATQPIDLPYFVEGEVVSGFGRGSKELGIPTANFPESVIRHLPSSFECGVYYGWAKLKSYPQVFKMTMCVGWNPYYHNTVKTMETHIINEFDADFYGDIMKIVVLGFMRPMCDFPSLDALIKAIHNDIEVASKHLDSEESLKFKDDPFFLSFDSNASNGNDATVQVNQSKAPEAHGKTSGTENSIDDVSSPKIPSPLSSDTSERNGNAFTLDTVSTKDSHVNGIGNTSAKNLEGFAKENIQSCKSSYSNEQFSQPVPIIDCADNHKDNI